MKIELAIENEVFAIIDENTDTYCLDLAEFINIKFNDIYSALDFDVNDWL